MLCVTQKIFVMWIVLQRRRTTTVCSKFDIGFPFHFGIFFALFMYKVVVSLQLCARRYPEKDDVGFQSFYWLAFLSDRTQDVSCTRYSSMQENSFWWCGLGRYCYSKTSYLWAWTSMNSFRALDILQCKKIVFWECGLCRYCYTKTGYLRVCTSHELMPHSSHKAKNVLTTHLCSRPQSVSQKSVVCCCASPT